MTYATLEFTTTGCDALWYATTPVGALLFREDLGALVEITCVEGRRVDVMHTGGDRQCSRDGRLERPPNVTSVDALRRGIVAYGRTAFLGN